MRNASNTPAIVFQWFTADYVESKGGIEALVKAASDGVQPVAAGTGGAVALTESNLPTEGQWETVGFTRFQALGDEQGSAGLLAHLLGPADPDDPVCADVGCGTGLHFRAVRANGYTVVGIDLSADQLRIAASRNPHLVRADAAQLPLATASVPAVVMTFTHPDVDDFPTVVREAARVLRPGGRLIYLGPHPAYVSAFIDRSAEGNGGVVRISPGYGDERRQHDPTGRFPLRSHVGVRFLTMRTFLNAFLAQPGLRVTGVEELDTRMRPWHQHPTDGRIIPWNIAITAVAGAELGR